MSGFRSSRNNNESVLHATRYTRDPQLLHYVTFTVLVDDTVLLYLLQELQICFYCNLNLFFFLCIHIALW